MPAKGTSNVVDRGAQDGAPDRGDDGPRPVQRVTVNLSARAVDALDEITELTGDTKTEAINKALQTYALVQHAQSAGGGAWLQDRDGAEPVRSRFY